jgi:hypothetical protein
LYFVARRGGKLIWRSLWTKNLEQARRLVGKLLFDFPNCHAVAQ